METGGHSGSGSDGEGEDKAPGATGEGDGKKEKRLMAPRKKFEWTDEIRFVTDIFKVWLHFCNL